MLTLARARELLTYDSATGVFTWAVDRVSIKAGAAAGGVNAEGYVRIRVGERTYLAHRLAWLFITGAWPTGEMDHINGHRADNRAANLREVTKAQNAQNRRPHRNNRSGTSGVTWYPRDSKWLARIVVDGERQSLGLFDTVDAAREARHTAEQLLLTHAPMRA